jgi:hypothetical protein
MLTFLAIAAAVYLVGALVTFCRFMWEENMPLTAIDAPMLPFVLLVAFGWPLGVLSCAIDWIQKQKGR